jgi:hypothetical protein
MSVFSVCCELLKHSCRGMPWESLMYSAVPYGAGRPGMNQRRNTLIHGAPRGRVPRGSELKNARDGMFQHFPCSGLKISRNKNFGASRPGQDAPA